MPPWLAVLGGLIVIVGFLAGAAGYIGHATDKATINTLKESRDSFKFEVESVLKPQVANLSQRVEFLEKDNEHLRQNQATDVLLEMKALLEKHSQDLQDHDIETRPLLMAISTQLGDLMEGVDSDEDGS